MIQAPKRFFKTDEEISNYIQEIYNTMGIDDLKPTGARTVEPTKATLGKGRFTIVELSGVPYLYYNSLNEVLYRISMTAV